jgi:hypothetical protein
MRSHRTSWASLAFGLLFVGAGVLLLTNGVDLATRLHWVGPIFLIVVAFCLIASAVADRPRPVTGARWSAPAAPVPATPTHDPAQPPAADDPRAES